MFCRSFKPALGQPPHDRSNHPLRRMWAGRDKHASLKDVLLVPRDVRTVLDAWLPPHTFTMYGMSGEHVVAVTSKDDHAYEIYVPHSTARAAPAFLRQLVDTQASHATLARLLPPDACKALPIARCVVDGDAIQTMDVLYCEKRPCASFPLTVNVMYFRPDNLILPVSMQLGSTLIDSGNSP